MKSRTGLLYVTAVLAMAGAARAQAPLDLDDPAPASAPAPVASASPAQPTAPPTPAPALPGPPVVTAEPKPASIPAAPAAVSHVAEWIGQDYTVVEATAVMAAPAADAPIASRLRPGAKVDVIGILSDPDWLEVRLPDTSLGYVRTASIPAVMSASAPAPTEPKAAAAADPAASHPGLTPIRGLAYVQDTATLMVMTDDGAGPVQVPLTGVDGFSGEPKLGLSHYLEASGSEVGCDPSEGARYICRVGDGTDIARAALVNGVARISPAAPRDYGVQQQAAIAARRGIWRDGEQVVAAIPYAGQSSAAPQPGEYVAGVTYEAGPAPQAFLAAAPMDGLAFIDGQPFTLDESLPAPVVFEEGVGWGFWDRSFKWRQVPDRWGPRLDALHPRGAGLRPVELERHGFQEQASFFRGPAVHASFLPSQGPIAVGHTPYVPAAFSNRLPPALANRPAAGFGVPGMRPSFPPGGVPSAAPFGGPIRPGPFGPGGGAEGLPFRPGRGPLPAVGFEGPHPNAGRPFAPGFPQPAARPAPGTERGFGPVPASAGLVGRPFAAPATGAPPAAFNRPPPAPFRLAPAQSPAMVSRAPAPMQPVFVRPAPPVMMARPAPPMIVARPAMPVMIARPMPAAMPVARPAPAPAPRPPPPVKTH